MERTAIRLGLIAAAAALALNSGVASAEVKWDMANEYPATSIHGEGDARFAEIIKKKSAGQIIITLHYGASLGFKSKDQLDAVGDGAIPIGDTYVGPLGGIDPMFLLPSLPFLAATPDEARILFEVAKPYYDRVFAANNQMLLYASPWPPSGIWGKRPIDSTAALKNLKIRTYDANGTITLRAAGAAPIQLSWADVVPQLGTGGIDAVLTSAEGGVNSKFWEHLNHFTEINYAMPLNMVHINLDTFKGLSPDLQKAVLDSAAEASAGNWKALDGRRQGNYATMKKNGVTVVQGVSSTYLKALADAGQGALDQWLQKTGAKGQAIIAEYKKRTGK